MIIFNLLLGIIFINQEVFAIDIKQRFYEKDLSEYCKRRVIPSIFLGRHVVEASSFILHFTKLNLPYNCFISIRAEAGSNMIMVITLPKDVGLDMSCSANNPQLLVYEMGETFGGYWGMLPEVILRQKPPNTKFYTLKTTEVTTESTEASTEEEIETTADTPAPEDPQDSQEYIRVEVPIVDVSGKLMPGSEQPTMPYDFEEAFDYQFDVTPIPGVKYETSILPLVQLSVRKQPDEGRRVGQGPLYELDVVEEFTPDPRLTLPRFSSNQKYKTNANRRLSFGKNKGNKGTSRKSYRMTTTNINRPTKYVFPSTIPSNNKLKSSYASRNSWELIEELMEKIKKNKEHEDRTEDKKSKQNNDKTSSKVAENISNMKHNFSIYLEPNLSLYNDVKSSNLLQFKEEHTMSPVTPRTMHTFRNLVSKSKPLAIRKGKKTTKSDHLIFLNTLRTQRQDRIHRTTKPVISTLTSHATSKSESSSIKKYVLDENPTIHKKSSTTKTIKLTNRTVPAVSLVDHESWENIVQVAPSMAVLLNQSVPYNAVNKSDGGWSSLNETYRKELLERKKRAIQSIAIDSGRPYNLTTKAKAPTTTQGVYNVADMQEFARLVELQDDEVHGRVALRYLKQYVGPALYNICRHEQPHNRHVYLFNSSRIVLSLNNFSLSRMSVILTGARTLLSTETTCPSSQLECQVSGARVCVDSLAACDGVPNCGSYDIYDEDRLMCGVALGLQHNVYLAAFTFLALLLTLFYAVHYWLKRCVPKVADAFFVYTDGIENVLYLDSIMRPPGDYDDGSRMFYHGNMYSSNLNPEFTHMTQTNLCTRFFKKICFCFRKKGEETEDDDEREHEMFTPGQRKTYSFTQMELGNIGNMLVRPTVDTSVQTGDSLEMNRETTYQKQSEPIGYCDDDICYARTKSKKTLGTNEKSVGKTKDSRIMIGNSLLTLDEPLPEEELSLMKFFRDSRSDSSGSLKMKERFQTKLDFKTGAAPGGEQEISNIVYDGLLPTRPGPSGVKPKPKLKPKLSSRSRKRIRFQEAATMIPSTELSDDDVDDEGKQTRHQRQLLSLGQSRTWRSQHLGTIKEDVESGSPHRHFWEGKGKKSHKKRLSFR